MDLGLPRPNERCLAAKTKRIQLELNLQNYLRVEFRAMSLAEWQPVCQPDKVVAWESRGILSRALRRQGLTSNLNWR